MHGHEPLTPGTFAEIYKGWGWSAQEVADSLSWAFGGNTLHVFGRKGPVAWISRDHETIIQLNDEPGGRPEDVGCVDYDLL